MQGWIDGFQKSIEYIERNLSETLDIGEIAAKAALSPFYYQRIFGALCGMTVGEYIRARRMTQAAQELAGNYSFETYMPPAKDPADTVSYIWIPLKKL